MISSPSPWIPTLTLLLLSLPIIFFFTSHILPPPPPPILSLPDELDDLTLFRRAAAVDSHPTHKPISRLGSTNRKPKIAFLFLTNTPLHFAPLWERFFNPNNSVQIKNLYNVYVHSDPTVKPYVKPPGGVFSQDRFIPAKQTFRGTATLIAAARRLIAAAIIDDPDNMFFTLVSQHCIPLHSFQFVYTARGNNVMTPEVKFENFRVGSQFFTLTRRHGLMVVKERRLWKKFRLPCLRPQSCYPEEHYFPTLLSNVDPDGCAGYTLTRVNWTDSVNGHPHTYYPSELSPELIFNLRRSSFALPYMFARKFSPDCLKPLMEMADEVIFRD
ncbi:putative glycosyl transferase, family 14 [Helianthus annuus]|nr:putative glycosyl transferase, family 14 [Helianthus annuus]